MQHHSTGKARRCRYTRSAGQRSRRACLAGSLLGRVLIASTCGDVSALAAGSSSCSPPATAGWKVGMRGCQRKAPVPVWLRAPAPHPAHSVPLAPQHAGSPVSAPIYVPVPDRLAEQAAPPRPAPAHLHRGFHPLPGPRGHGLHRARPSAVQPAQPEGVCQLARAGGPPHVLLVGQHQQGGAVQVTVPCGAGTCSHSRVTWQDWPRAAMPRRAGTERLSARAEAEPAGDAACATPGKRTISERHRPDACRRKGEAHLAPGPAPPLPPPAARGLPRPRRRRGRGTLRSICSRWSAGPRRRPRPSTAAACPAPQSAPN